MKVKALFHINQKVGSLFVERVMGTIFELDDDSAVKGIAAGIIEATEVMPTHQATPKKYQGAKYRETK